MATPPSSQMTLKEKLRASWQGEDIDPKASKMADLAASTYFWFIAVTELYVVMEYIVPYGYQGWSDMSQYYLKVFACFIFIQATANWACVRCYSGRNAYRITEDRPDINKLLWDSHPEEQIENGKVSPVLNGQPHSNGHGQPWSNGHVAVDMSDKEDHKSHGYLAWRFCKICRIHSPPRSHHCKMCKVCILKRDHHCYMTGVCIGHYNVRFFIILNFYVIIASFYGLYEIYNYMAGNFNATADYWDFFLPWTIYRWLFTEIPTHILFMMFHFYTLWWTGACAMGFFGMQMAVTYIGLTSHEMRHKLPVRCTGRPSKNFQEVFGVFWVVNFFMPGHLMFRQQLDGTEWPNLKPDNRRLFRKVMRPR